VYAAAGGPQTHTGPVPGPFAGPAEGCPGGREPESPRLCILLLDISDRYIDEVN
jgi:hypothetical protein